MKQHIATTKLPTIRPVFANVGENIRRYQQLRSMLDYQNGHLLFAEPTIGGVGGLEIDWFTERPDTPKRLTDNVPDQPLQQQIKLVINALYRDLIRFSKDSAGQYDLKRYAELCKTLDSCIEIPGWDSIYQNESGEIVLINWGFIDEKFNAQRGFLKKILVTRVTSAIVQVHFRDNKQPAPNESFWVCWSDPLNEYPAFAQQLTTDDSGQIHLENIPFLADLSLKQGGEQANTPVFKLRIDERPPAQPYEVLIDRHLTNMKFKVVDVNQPDIPVAGIPIRFEWGANDTSTQISPEDGRLYLVGVPLNSVVTCQPIQTGTPAFSQQFTSTQQQETEFLIKIPKPDTPLSAYEPMHFRVIMPDGTPAAQARLRCSLFGGQVIEHITDQEGTVALTQLSFGTTVEATATKGNLSSKRLCTHRAEISTHSLQLSRKGIAWWWWLLLALLLLLGIYAWWQMNQTPPAPPPPPPAQEVPAVKVSVRVRAIDKSTQQPIENAVVEINGGPAVATDQQGWAIIPNLEPNKKVKIDVSKEPDYGEKRKTGIATDLAEFVVELTKIDAGGLKGKQGDIRVNLQWNTRDDLDLILVDPMGKTVSFSTKTNISGQYKAELDVDANVDGRISLSPQENIFCENPISGEYKFIVSWYKKRSNIRPLSFKAFIQIDGQEEIVEGKIEKVKGHTVIKIITVPPL